jgi:hypothetical protein
MASTLNRVSNAHSIICPELRPMRKTPMKCGLSSTAYVTRCVDNKLCTKCSIFVRQPNKQFIMQNGYATENAQRQLPGTPVDYSSK